MGQGAAGDILVLDLSTRVAGAYCTKLLADHGARVIKIEPPGLGEPTRRLRPFLHDRPEVNSGGFFLYLNTNKESITLDLETASGRELFRRLVGRSDLVVETLGPGRMRSLGLGLADLEKVNSRLVLTSISDFGSDGPYADYQATDAVTFGLGGWMYPMGDPDKPPLQPGGPYGEFVAGLFAVSGALAAIALARLSGLGQEVEVSVHEAVASVLPFDTVVFSYSGEVIRRSGHHYRGISPSTAIMPCKDGFVQYQNGSPDKWRGMLRLIGRPDLAEDARYSTPQAALKHMDEIEGILGAWFKDRSKHEIFQEALKHRLIFSWVPSVRELMEADHHRFRDYWVEIEHPQTGSLRYPGPPFRLGQTPWTVRRPAPLLGEHNGPVYGGLLNLTGQDLVALGERGII